MAQKINGNQQQYDVYSASEVDTGSKYLDGKTIYTKTYTGTIASADLTVVDASFPASYRLLDAHGFRRTTDGEYHNIFPDNAITIGRNPNGLVINHTSIYGGRAYMVRIFYIK